jgi:hypothetical protein
LRYGFGDIAYFKAKDALALAIFFIKGSCWRPVKAAEVGATKRELPAERRDIIELPLELACPRVG